MKINIDFKINPVAVSTLNKAIEKGLTQSLIEIQADAFLLSPVNTGNYKDSIKYDVNENKGIVYSEMEYAPYLEFGTKAHFPPIKELKEWCRKKLGDENLAFAVARSIGKRGTPARNVFSRALYKNKDKAVRLIANTIKAVT